MSIASGRVGGAFSFTIKVLTDRPGYLVLRVTGKDAERAFRNEAGGHRWQRISPTEKRGRVHTSTITVAVLPEPREAEVRLPKGDLIWKTCRARGPGGQSVNTTNSAVQLKHKPTGITVICQNEKSQHQNKELAKAVLRARLYDLERNRQQGARNATRKGQLGSGMRGDKRRTIAVQRGQVHDHVTGKRTTIKRYLRGSVDDLWP